MMSGFQDGREEGAFPLKTQNIALTASYWSKQGIRPAQIQEEGPQIPLEDVRNRLTYRNGSNRQ